MVIVEGLISGGKTTLTRELGEALGASTLILIEPDEKNESNPYLADYYTDPPRWSYTMQCHMLAMRFRMHLHAQWHAMQGFGHAILDRSYFGDTAFAQLQLQLGLMSEREFETYRQLYHAMTASVLLPTICLRVLVSPEVAIERIKKRLRIETGRECEAGIDLDYLRGLDREIDHMVGVLRQQGVTVLDVPWDATLPDSESRRQVVGSLASRIMALEVPDSLLDHHRRSL